MFYLVFKEWADILMICDEVYPTAKQFLKILRCCDVVVELWWHGYKKVNITVFIVLIAGYRPEKAHGSDAKPRLQFASMGVQCVDVIIPCSHLNKLRRVQKYKKKLG